MQGLAAGLGAQRAPAKFMIDGDPSGAEAEVRLDARHVVGVEIQIQPEQDRLGGFGDIRDGAAAGSLTDH